MYYLISFNKNFLKNYRKLLNVYLTNSYNLTYYFNCCTHQNFNYSKFLVQLDFGYDIKLKLKL